MNGGLLNKVLYIGAHTIRKRMNAFVNGQGMIEAIFSISATMLPWKMFEVDTIIGDELTTMSMEGRLEPPLQMRKPVLL